MNEHETLHASTQPLLAATPIPGPAGAKLAWTAPVITAGTLAQLTENGPGAGDDGESCAS